MIVKISVDDRNNPGKQIELPRYAIPKNSEPIGIVFGKFSPWTGKNGHGKLVSFLKTNGIKSFYVVSPKREESQTGKYSPDIFSADSRKEIIERVLKNEPGFLGVIKSDSNNVMGVIKHIIHLVDRPVFVVGPDRERLAKTNFVAFGSNPAKENEAGFGKPEILVYTGDRDVSGTKIRKSLVDNDFKTFSSLTNYDNPMFNYMRNLMNVKKESFNNFYTTIFEGGNLRIGDNKANKIDLTSSDYSVNALKSRIKDTICCFCDSFEDDFWSYYSTLVKRNQVFSGSSKHFFEKSLIEFSKIKKSVGDIDIQFPIEKEEELDTHIKNNVGRQFGDMILLGQGGRSPIQINTLFADNVTGLNIQIDFEPIDFKDRLPSNFAKFSRSSDWIDLKNNIKGVFHKYLIRCLVGNEKINDIFVVTSYNENKCKWRVSKKKIEGTNLKGFSVDRGVRIKYERAKNKEGFEFFVDSYGTEYLEYQQGVKPAYIETDTKTVDYIKDVDVISSICFGRDLTPEEKIKFNSFMGCVELVKTYLGLDIVRDGFFDLLFGPSAQEIEQGEFENGINNNDFQVKFAAFSKIAEVEQMNQLSEDELEQILSFYNNLRKKKNVI